MIYDPLPIGRVCRVCVVWKPFAELKKHKYQPDGVEKMCLACNREQAAMYYTDNSEQVKRKLRDAYTRDPKRVNKRNRRSRDKPENKLKSLVRSNQWKANHPEKVRETKRRWSKTHPEQVKESKRRSRAKRPDYYQQKEREYAIAHQDQRRAIQKKSNEKRRGWLKEYKRLHREQYRIYANNRRARILALPFTFTESDWNFALTYFGHCCSICKRPAGLWHKMAQDHWVPVTKGGAYAPDNILPLCHGLDGCNNSKHDSDPVEWLTRKLGKRNAAARLRVIEDYFAIVRK